MVRQLPPPADKVATESMLIWFMPSGGCGISGSGVWFLQISVTILGQRPLSPVSVAGPLLSRPTQAIATSLPSMPGEPAVAQIVGGTGFRRQVVFRNFTDQRAGGPRATPCCIAVQRQVSGRRRHHALRPEALVQHRPPSSASPRPTADSGARFPPLASVWYSCATSIGVRPIAPAASGRQLD